MSFYKNRLNDYERSYFEKFFGNNIKRLLCLRKSLHKRIRSMYDYDNDKFKTQCQTVQKFRSKGGKEHYVNISRKMIDIYIESLGYNVNELIGPRFTKRLYK